MNCRARFFRDRGIDPDRICNVLEVPLTQINELDPDLASNMTIDGRRNANATRLGNPFKPRRDVDVVTEDIVRLDDHIANIDSNAEQNARVFWIIDCQVANTLLELGCSPNSRDSTRKFCQQSVPGVLDDATSVFGYCWIDCVRRECR